MADEHAHKADEEIKKHGDILDQVTSAPEKHAETEEKLTSAATPDSGPAK